MRLRAAIVFVLVTLAPLAAETLTLGEAAVQALQRHPDLQAAEGQVRAQEFSVMSSRAPYYPTVNGGVSFNRNDASGQGGLQNVIRTGVQDTYAISLSARQQLLDFGRTHHKVKAAEGQLLASIAEREDAAQTLLLTVVESYFSALREAQSVEISQADLANAERQLEQARGFLEAGTRAKIEVTRAQADVANARVRLIQAENAKKKALVALAAAMGRPNTVQEDLLFTSLPSPGWDIGEATSQALKLRPDLLAQEARLGAAESTLDAAKAEYRPVIASSASYIWNDSTFPPAQTRWSVGLNLEVPIFNEPLLGSQVGQAKANVDVASARRDSIELTVRREVSEAVLNLEEAQQRFTATDAGLQSAEENFRLASERYRVGVGNSIEVSEAQRLLVQARAQLLQARFDVELARGRLYRLVGALTPELLFTGTLPGIESDGSSWPGYRPKLDSKNPDSNSDSAEPDSNSETDSAPGSGGS